MKNFFKKNKLVIIIAILGAITTIITTKQVQGGISFIFLVFAGNILLDIVSHNIEIQETICEDNVVADKKSKIYILALPLLGVALFVEYYILQYPNAITAPFIEVLLSVNNGELILSFFKYAGLIGCFLVFNYFLFKLLKLIFKFEKTSSDNQM